MEMHNFQASANERENVKVSFDMFIYNGLKLMSNSLGFSLNKNNKTMLIVFYRSIYD